MQDERTIGVSQGCTLGTVHRRPQPIADADPPRLPVPLRSDHAEIDEAVLGAEFQGDFGSAVGGILRSQATEIELHSLALEGDAGVGQLHLGHADPRRQFVERDWDGRSAFLKSQVERNNPELMSNAPPLLS